MIALSKKLSFYFIMGLFLIESRASKYIGTALLWLPLKLNPFNKMTKFSWGGWRRIQWRWGREGDAVIA